MNKPEELKKLAELINNLTDEDFNMSSSAEDEWDEDYDPYFYMCHNEKADDIEELCNA